MSSGAGSWAANTYNAASDVYDDPANGFWERFGRRTIERLELPAGARVLDAACGSGASALPAAEAVGPSGSVLAVDVADGMLALAREKAQARGLANIEFRTADMRALDEPDGTFDAVVCVFAIFFCDDMPAAARELWRHVRPGGRLAITTWGRRMFEPGTSLFWGSIRDVRPDLERREHRFERVSEREQLRDLLTAGGAPDAEVAAVAATHPLARAEDWWKVVLGTGYRSTVDQLTPEQRERVHEANIEGAREQRIASIEVNVNFGVAVKPAG